MTRFKLERENLEYGGRGGVSAETASLGFRPAFMDLETGCVYDSCFADGRPAPVHVIDGLPPHLVVRTSAAGQVVCVKDSVIAGFVWCERFLTREQAACAVARVQPLVDLETAELDGSPRAVAAF